MFGSNKETIRKLVVPQFDQKMSKNKELQELGLELGSLHKKVCIKHYFLMLVAALSIAGARSCSLKYKSKRKDQKTSVRRPSENGLRCEITRSGSFSIPNVPYKLGFVPIQFEFPLLYDIPSLPV